MSVTGLDRLRAPMWLFWIAVIIDAIFFVSMGYVIVMSEWMYWKERKGGGHEDAGPR